MRKKKCIEEGLIGPTLREITQTDGTLLEEEKQVLDYIRGLALVGWDVPYDAKAIRHNKAVKLRSRYESLMNKNIDDLSEAEIEEATTIWEIMKTVWAEGSS